MPRRRAAESVPEVEPNIEEVIIRHRKTKRGVRTTEKTVPIVVPNKKGITGQSAGSKKGRHPPLDPNKAEGSQGAMPTMDDTQTSQFIDDHLDDFPNLETEKDDPQTLVSTNYHLQEVNGLIVCRL